MKLWTLWILCALDLIIFFTNKLRFNHKCVEINLIKSFSFSSLYNDSWSFWQMVKHSRPNYFLVTPQCWQWLMVFAQISDLRQKLCIGPYNTGRRSVVVGKSTYRILFVIKNTFSFFRLFGTNTQKLFVSLVHMHPEYRTDCYSLSADVYCCCRDVFYYFFISSAFVPLSTFHFSLTLFPDALCLE